MGLNIDKALFTIATTGTKSAIANLVKQLSKLVKVRCLPKASSFPGFKVLMHSHGASPMEVATTVYEWKELCKTQVDEWIIGEDFDIAVNGEI